MSKWLVEKKGYTFDRRLFIIALLAIIIFVLLAIIFEAPKTAAYNYYITCPEGALHQCENVIPERCLKGDPYAVDICGEYCDNPSPVCSQVLLEPGEGVGPVPGPLSENAVVFSLGIVALTFLTNHLAYNRRFKL